MTSEEMAAIRARLDAASPGPWRGDCESGSVRRAVLDATGALVVHGSDHDGDPYYGIHEPEGQDYAPNAALIVNTPTDLAALLDEVARLAAEVERLSAMVPRWEFGAPSRGELMVGECRIGSVVRMSPGDWSAWATDGDGAAWLYVCRAQTAESACRAVCARLGLPYIAPPEGT